MVIVDDCTQPLAFSHQVKNYNIIIVIDDGDYLFCGFELKGNSLKVMEINRKLRTEDFGSQKELISFFNKNIDKSNFFLEPPPCEVCQVLEWSFFNQTLR